MAVGTSHNAWIWLSRVEKILLRLWNYCACHAKAGVTFAPERGSHSPLNPLHRTSCRGKCDPTWFRGKCDPRARERQPLFVPVLSDSIPSTKWSLWYDHQMITYRHTSGNFSTVPCFFGGYHGLLIVHHNYAARNRASFWGKARASTMANRESPRKAKPTLLLFKGGRGPRPCVILCGCWIFGKRKTKNWRLTVESLLIDKIKWF